MSRTTLRRGFRAAAAAAAFAVLPLGLGAQEAAADSFGSFFGGDASGGAESSDAAVSGAAAASSLAIGGSVGLDVRAFLDDDALDAVSRDGEAADGTETVPLLKLDLSYRGASTEFVANLKLSEPILEDHPADVVQEAYARLYAGDFVLETGKMKLVWGKGDELHVVDLFNANDYADFIFPDYADRRLAEPMVHLAWNSASGLRAEAVWTPTMTADRIPTSGYWAPARALSLAALAESYATYQGLQAYSATYQSVYLAQTGAGIGAAEAAVAASAAASLAQTSYLSDHSEAAAFLPETDQLDLGQYGLRLTGTAGSLDWGLLYYLGHFKTPSAQVSYDAATGYVSDLSLSYDRLQSFGLEGGMVVGPVNFRAEAAYYLTDDVKGDDPAVANNSLNWVFGFDVGLPVHNASINIQTVGKYVLGSDGIDSAADVDWDADEVYANDKLVVRLADNWLREKLQAEVKLVWGIERGDVVVMPSVKWNAADDLFFAVSGAFFPGADDGEFTSFSDNRFVKLSATYKF